MPGPQRLPGAGMQSIWHMRPCPGAGTAGAGSQRAHQGCVHKQLGSSSKDHSHTEATEAAATRCLREKHCLPLRAQDRHGNHGLGIRSPAAC